MRVALVHDYLNQWGGAERVLEVFAEMFPDAPIYTLLYDEKKTIGKFKNKRIVTSFLDNKIVRVNHRNFIPLMPLAMYFLKLESGIDLVISSSASYAKGIRLDPNTKHLAYIHTPIRYAWESRYIPPEITKIERFLYRPLISYIRRWDYKVAQKPEVLIANSFFISDKIKKFYNRDSLVIYPPLDLSIFYPPTSIPKRNLDQKTHGQTDSSIFPKDYFLAIGRFLHYKKFDLIIEAFGELGLHIKITGSGPEENNLKKMASGFSNIEFVPFVETNDSLRELYQNARAVIFPQIEDFGLVAAESIACGTPVIALNDGGAKEIVNDHSGVLFPHQSKKFLIKAVNEFIEKESNYKVEIVSEQAKKFGKEHFKQEILKVIEHYFTPR